MQQSSYPAWSLHLLRVNRAADRADAKRGPAEIQVVGAVRPARGADAEDMLAVRLRYLAHRVGAAPAGLQT